VAIFNLGYVKFELKKPSYSLGCFTQGTLLGCPMGLVWFGLVLGGAHGGWEESLENKGNEKSFLHSNPPNWILG
jgi:hypothetical protein